jgi:hypothetical protein
MSDRATQIDADFVPLWETSPRLVFFMSGFDAVNSGNDEYILLTPSDREVGEIRQFYQLPNDAGTIKEMMHMAADAGGDVPYICPSLMEMLVMD